VSSGKLIDAESSPTLDKIPKRAGARSAKTGSSPAKLAQGAAEALHAERAVRPALTVVLIESRPLLRECWTAAIKEVPDCDAIAFAAVEDWRDRSASVTASVILLCMAAPSPRAVQAQLEALKSRSDVPVMILCDDEQPESAAKCLDLGARGYVPTSTTVRVAVQAIRLVAAGGLFVPASYAMKAAHASSPIGNGFALSARQMAVVESLRRGKSNKEIARELKLRETTVKVHVRNIMRKLKARNRTEVAFLLDQRNRHADDTGAV
jgi:DNA-binding NarL/FixJ family response regulator